MEIQLFLMLLITRLKLIRLNKPMLLIQAIHKLMFLQIQMKLFKMQLLIIQEVQILHQFLKIKQRINNYSCYSNSY
jgi:hypothetical protein